MAIKKVCYCDSRNHPFNWHGCYSRMIDGKLMCIGDEVDGEGNVIGERICHPCTVVPYIAIPESELAVTLAGLALICPEMAGVNCAIVGAYLARRLKELCDTDTKEVGK